MRTGRGFSEGIIEAWANLYTEFALQVAANKDVTEVPDCWLMCPDVAYGATGVHFVEAAVQSHENGGEWISVEAMDPHPAAELLVAHPVWVSQCTVLFES